jgi:hypothetical protein
MAESEEGRIDETAEAALRRRKPQDSPALRNEKSHYMSPAPVELGDGRDDSPFGELASRMYARIAGLLGIGWLLLLVKYPIVWAVVTCVLLAVALGLFTTKVVFRFETPKEICGWTPLFGLGWLAIFWAIFKLHSFLH